MTFAEMIAFIIDVFEGGSKYTDAPGDHGGATKYGVTRGFRALALGRPVSKAEIRRLTRAQAVDTYRIVLLERGRLGSIQDWRVLFAVFDFAVNAGEDDAIPALQRAVGTTPDGVLGSKTLAALQLADGLLIATRVIATRQAFHIKRSYAPQQAQWLRGWLNRCTVNLQRVTAPGSAVSLRGIRKVLPVTMRGGFASHAERVAATRRHRP